MKQQSNNAWLLPVALVVTALIVAVAINWPGMMPATDQPGKNNTIVVNVPGEFTKQVSTSTEGSPARVSEGVISFAADETGNQKRLISVSGSITKSVTPDKADITISVETLDKSASKSQSDNAATAQKVRDALKAAGIDDKDIKTVGYYLNEEFKWNRTTEESESVGYRTTNTIQVTVRDLTKTGTVIDASAQAGANRVTGVSFSLSQQKEDELRTQALQEASANAKSKATSMATGLGITLGQVFSASENASYSMPYYRSNYAMETGAVAKDAALPTTPITAGDVDFTVSVSVQFEIQ